MDTTIRTYVTRGVDPWEIVEVQMTDLDVYKAEVFIVKQTTKSIADLYRRFEDKLVQNSTALYCLVRDTIADLNKIRDAHKRKAKLYEHVLITEEV